MIRSIELWNWENHEHTVLRDLAPGFNLICGRSDSGKSSLVRALRLVSYNEFDPASVRVGCKNAVVRVETDRGWLKVTRGQENTWEIGLNGKPVETYKRVGKAILPAAAEVMGMPIVRLGMVDIPINLMRQEEAHFLLSQVGGETASGSMRAQVIDQVSGLAGVEDLVRAIGLDHLRTVREVKDKEEANEALLKQLHDEAALQREDLLLKQAEGHLAQAAEAQDLALIMAEAADQAAALQGGLTTARAGLRGLPNVGLVRAHHDEARDTLELATEAAAIDQEAVDLNRKLNTAQAAAREVDIPSASARLRAATKAITTATDADAVCSEAETLNRKLNVAQEAARDVDVPATAAQLRAAAKALATATEADEAYSEAETLSRKLGEARTVVQRVDIATLNSLVCRAAEVIAKVAGAVATRDEALAAKGAHDGLFASIQRAAAEEQRLYSEVQELLKSITVCPLTLLPVSSQCLSGLKPLTSSSQKGVPG